MTTSKRTDPYIDIKDGKVRAHVKKGLQHGVSFTPDDEGTDALAQYLAALEGFEPGDGLLCSSSVDFPEDYGVPAGFDVRAMLDKAIKRCFH